MTQDEAAVDPTRVKNFARFFKNYMSISAIVAAVLPIPVTAFKLIPTYKAHTALLSTYPSLFCFLLLGFIFYSRHHLARVMFLGFPSPTLPWATRLMHRLTRFSVAILPVILIMLSLACVYLYHGLLDQSVARFLMRPAEMLSSEAATVDPQTTASASPSSTPQHTADVLNNIESYELPESGRLVLLYLGIFLFAESAFIIMAIKEYLQDLMKLSEMELIA